MSRVIPYLLGSINVDPVLLHGDLWVSIWRTSYENIM